ncbi:DUF998 domain-containing protein [Microbacterium sp. ASV81]|uniref:DUF998 domain-containing protein n=1 Tax=Microbacterium capsulatum TaxID=3041921 RepID=A0ABU0XFM4_9MICO|nr:DUF998 domain-containing protein [Microbacterium sp. ASV81]MDQ4213913.1 DUF998 domain-containing protein [Microbacterium sp. ASV81]
MNWHPRIPFVLLAAFVLCAAILAAALTTADPRWWLSCFSRLGAMRDGSSALFNVGAITAGAMIALSAVPVSLGLRGASPAIFRARTRVLTLVPLLIATLGASLIMVGVLPLSLSVFAHERAANGALASSAGLLLVHSLYLRGLSRALDRIATGAVVVLVLGIAGLITGVLTLTVFEAMAFGSVITWLHVLEMRVKRFTRAVPTGFSANSQQKLLSPIWGTRYSGVTV